MTELDNANLQYKDNPIPLPQINLIKEEDVADILKKDYVLGQQSEEIRLLQEFLRQEGYYMNREITGVFGVVTQEALQNYRASHGIITSLASAACLALINQNWQIGTQSDQVAQLQQCLRDMGVFSFPSNTGYFGPITQSALGTAKTAIANLQTQGAKRKTRCETLSEYFAIVGAENTINRCRPTICVEQKKDNYDVKNMALDLLKKMNYKTVAIISGDYIMIPNEYSAALIND